MRRHHRLTKRIRIGGQPKQSVLFSWTTLRDGRLSLKVNGNWLPSECFDRVALPLPSQERSRALPLYLWLHAINFEQPRKIRLDRLLDVLGLARSRRADAKRAIMRAVKVVNDHLRMLGPDPIYEYRIRGGRIPTAIRLEFLDANYVRITDASKALARAVAQRDGVFEGEGEIADPVHEDDPLHDYRRAGLREWNERQQREWAASLARCQREAEEAEKRD